VPRTKEFEPGEALDAAMQLFWRNGYAATSIRDLLDGMGIGYGSLYNTFGDKHALFLACLDRFQELRTSWIDEVLEDSDLSGIEEVFRRTVDGLVSFEPRRGCLLANTAVELGPHDAEVAAKISRYVRHTEAVFERAVIRAQEAGEIPVDRDARALARFLVNALHGLRVLARVGTDRAVLEDAVRVALDVLH
jgi:TetR/AcrR family transcriptional regulator, transcriptional repressor for nem operon